MTLRTARESNARALNWRWGFKGRLLGCGLGERARQRRLTRTEVVEAALASLLTPDHEERIEAMVTRRLDRIARQLQVGAAFVNAIVRSDVRLPFGGTKRSGFGRELAEHGIHEFMNIKSVYVA